MKTVEFQSVRSPAHHVRPTGHKFVGGTLIVPERDAAGIRTYARTYPQFGIREIVHAPVPAPAPAAPPRLSRRAPRPAKPAPDPIPTPPDPVAPGASDEVAVEPTFAAAAEGGLVTGPTDAILGDAGDEIVVPLLAIVPDPELVDLGPIEPELLDE